MTKILEETSLIVKKIADYCSPDKIILFGSAAQGKETAQSDIDLLVIKSSAKKRTLRTKEVFEAIRGMKRNYPLDAIVYTPEEINYRISLGDYFITNIMNQGKIMYGK